MSPTNTADAAPGEVGTGFGAQDKRGPDARDTAYVRARALFQAVPIPIYAWQRVERGEEVEFILVDYNQAAWDITAGAVAALMGRGTSAISNPAVVDRFHTTLRDGVTSREELDYTLTSTGETKRFTVTYIPVPPDMVLVHTEDLTRRLALEAQLRHVQKMEAVGRLAGGIAHDFNNQLTVIMGQIGFVLRRMPDGSEDARSLREALAAAERSAELTRQLLAFARKQPIASRTLDLEEEITDAVTMLRRIIGKNVMLEWIPRGDAWPLVLDPTQLHQLLTNLVLNARDAIEGTGRVTITTENVTLGEAFCALHADARAGEYVLLAVADTGSGMTSQVRMRIFEPFFTTKDPGRGTGLGLSIAYGIVQQNAGFIEVESERGAGTTFRIFLPRASAKGPNATARANLPCGSETVLLVDDERAVLGVVRTMLTQLGYEVLSAAGPREAIAQFRAQADRIALVVTDLIMPEMSGRQLIRVLRDIKPGQASLLISGYPGTAATEGAVGDNGPLLLPKPITLNALAPAVRRALGD